jgi:hypothetical protein
MNNDNYLLDAVDRLTLNHITKVLQTKTVGDMEIACISDVDHEPLLRMLRDAVATGNDGKNGASSGASFLPINPAAVEMWDAIVKQINAWHRELPAPREHKYIWDRLREVYVDFENRRRAGKVTESAEADMLKLVEGWARNIESMFDPPITLELTEQHWEPVMLPKIRVRVVDGERVKQPVLGADGEPLMLPKLDRDNRPVSKLIKTEAAACPVCGERYAFDPKTGDQITALILEYRNIGTDTLDKATGLCRSCAMVWHGRTALRELSFDLDTKEDTEDLTA